MSKAIVDIAVEVQELPEVLATPTQPEELQHGLDIAIQEHAAALATSLAAQERVEGSRRAHANLQTWFREKTVALRQIEIDIADRFIEFASGTSSRPDSKQLDAVRREENLLTLSIQRLQDRLRVIEVESLVMQSQEKELEGRVEELHSKIEEQAAHQAIAKAAETLGDTATVTIDGSKYQLRMARADALYEQAAYFKKLAFELGSEHRRWMELKQKGTGF